MAYPLGGTARTSPTVRIVRNPIILRCNITRTWSGLSSPLFPSVNRLSTLRIVRNPRIHRIPVSRHWGGIGGIIYIPSFPQLDRQSTSYPHAF